MLGRLCSHVNLGRLSMSREAVLSPTLLNDKLKHGFPDNLVIAGFKAVE